MKESIDMIMVSRNYSVSWSARDNRKDLSG